MPRYFSAISSSFDELFVAAEAPVAAGLGVQVFGERFGQPVGQRLGHDRVVVVVIAVELRGQLVAADAGRDGERAEVILAAAVDRGDEIGQRIETPPALCAPTAAAACGSGTVLCSRDSSA